MDEGMREEWVEKYVERDDTSECGGKCWMMDAWRWTSGGLDELILFKCVGGGVEMGWNGWMDEEGWMGMRGMKNELGMDEGRDRKGWGVGKGEEEGRKREGGRGGGEAREP